MNFPQRKLNLNTPYKSIYQTLWHHKKVNQAHQKQNMQLKTQLYQVAQSQHASTACHNHKLQLKYKRLHQKHKEQTIWIQQTNHRLEEKNYQKLVQHVKKTQNKLSKLTKKALKMEKKVRSTYIKSKNNKDSQGFATIPEKKVDQIEEFEEDRAQLLKQYEIMSEEAQTLERRNKMLNNQLIQLLRIKNALREQKKKNLRPKSQSPKR